MGYIRREKNGEFDFEKLPEGSYYFSGEEGFVKVEVDRNGLQNWDLANWFDSLDPDETEERRQKIIQNIKKRLNADTGMINPHKRKAKTKFFNPFKK